MTMLSETCFRTPERLFPRSMNGAPDRMRTAGSMVLFHGFVDAVDKLSIGSEAQELYRFSTGGSIEGESVSGRR